MAVRKFALIFICFASLALSANAQQTLSGTLVVAVPVHDGLVVCADKRLYNHTTDTFADDAVKIRRVGESSLFVATNTIGFLDKKSGKIEFDVFQITEDYTATRPFVPDASYWNGLRTELRRQFLQYLKKIPFKDWPETDFASSKLLFNLVFYSADNGRVRSYSLKAFYEKAPTPVFQMPDVVSEIVRSPKLSGKGREVMNVLARNPQLGRDPSILRFDQGRFDLNSVSVKESVEFAAKLFLLTSRAAPKARVSAAHDCAILNYDRGFQWINDNAEVLTTK